MVMVVVNLCCINSAILVRRWWAHITYVSKYGRWLALTVAPVFLVAHSTFSALLLLLLPLLVLLLLLLLSRRQDGSRGASSTAHVGEHGRRERAEPHVHVPLERDVRLRSGESRSPAWLGSTGALGRLTPFGDPAPLGRRPF